MRLAVNYRLVSSLRPISSMGISPGCQLCPNKPESLNKVLPAYLPLSRFFLPRLSANSRRSKKTAARNLAEPPDVCLGLAEGARPLRIPNFARVQGLLAQT